MKMSLLAALTVSALLLLGGRAAADLTFVFADSSGNAANAFTVAQGSTISLEVFLQQSNGETPLSDTGLNSAGVQLNFDQTIANVPNTSAITPNPAFDASSTSVATGSATLNETQVLSDPVMAPTSGTNANRVLIGTFTFTGVAPGTTAVVTADPSAGADNVLGDGTVLDSMIANSSAAITVVAVPEPGPLYLTGLAVPLIGAGAWLALRRRTPTAVL